MAKILSVLTSSRKNGYTSQTFEAAVEGMKAAGAEVDEVLLPSYHINPCTSCFSCVRREDHQCVQNDDMGKKGEGALIKKILGAHALFIADPVYFWSNTSRSHIFLERFYPFLWTGKISGLPLGVVSCASNQGMMHEATREFCKIAFTLKMRWIDGINVHLADFKNQLEQCEYLGRKLAAAAFKVEKEGLIAPKEQEAAQQFMGYKWDPMYSYIYNLTQGTFDWSMSLPYKALAEKRFKNPEAIAHLEETVELLKMMTEAWNLKDLQRCTEIFPGLSAAWTGATWKEFLEDNVIGVGKPLAYRSKDK